MADSGGDKKHFATERRRKQAREEGQIAKSQDLTSATLLLAAILSLKTLGGHMVTALASTIESTLSDPVIGPFSPQDATNGLMRIGTRLAVATVPILLVMMLGAIIINVTQTGLLLSTAKLIPKLSNIDPLAGARRIASIQGAMRLLFGLFKVAIISIVAFFALRHHLDALMAMASLSTGELAGQMFAVLMGVCLWIGCGLFALAIIEYVFQRWKHEQDLMMTDQEMREEVRDTEGDPQVKARRRQVARQLALNRLGKDVPKADVVVSNPTELAIAIQYDPKTMPAPVVIAKGAGVIAQRIRRLALENGIPVVERKPLAQFLYKNVDVGQEIPADQYQAVAEVLRYVYQLQGKTVPKAA